MTQVSGDLMSSDLLPFIHPMFRAAAMTEAGGLYLDLISTTSVGDRLVQAVDLGRAPLDAVQELVATVVPRAILDTRAFRTMAGHAMRIQMEQLGRPLRRRAKKLRGDRKLWLTSAAVFA